MKKIDKRGNWEERLEEIAKDVFGEEEQYPLYLGNGLWKLSERGPITGQKGYEKFIELCCK